MNGRFLALATGTATCVAALGLLGGCGKHTDAPSSPEPAPASAPSREEDPLAWIKAICARNKCVEWTEYVGEGIGVEMAPRGRHKFCSVTRREPASDGGRGRVRWISMLSKGDEFYLDDTRMRVLGCDYRYTPDPPDIHLVMTLLVGVDGVCPAGDVCMPPIPWEEI